MSVDQMVGSLANLDIELLSREEANQALGSVRAVRSWADAIQGRLLRRLQALAQDNLAASPEADLAVAAKVSRREAEAQAKRAATLGELGSFDRALSSGVVSASHVDTMTRALARLQGKQRACLVAQQDRLAAIAAYSSPEQFERTVKQEAARLDPNEPGTRFQRQRRNTRLRCWTDRDSGMWCMHGEFDPEAGLLIQGRIENALEALFHAAVPEDCPVGEGRRDFLRALALAHLTAGALAADPDIASVVDRCDVSVVIDLHTLQHGVHQQSRMSTGSDGIEFPVDTYRRMACIAGIIPIVLNSDGVVVDLGRKVRLANRAQRRALAAMYKTCAMPGCCVASRHCQPHHLTFFRNGGGTDLANLVPLCSRHHHLVHEGGVVLSLGIDRSITVTYPDGTVLTTGPPGSAWVA